MGRKRARLVPEDSIEIFEIRLALYFTPDGRRHVEAVVSDPESRELDKVDLVELRGALDLGRDTLVGYYEEDDEPA